MTKAVKKLTNEFLVAFIAMAIVLIISMTHFLFVSQADTENPYGTSGISGISDDVSKSFEKGEKLTEKVNETRKSVVQVSAETITSDETVQNEIEKQEAEKQEQEKAAAAASARQAIADYAVQFVGNPYKAGGTSLTDGCDCSGFVYSVYRHFGYDVPRNGFQTVYKQVSWDELQPGDILYYSGHYTIYLGNGREISAENESNGIQIRDMSFRFSRRIKACRVIL